MLIKQYVDPSLYCQRMGTMNYITRQDDLWKWLANRYDLSNTKNLLDIGCGDGRIWKFLSTKATKDKNITLLDYSVKMLTESQKLIESNAIQASFSYKQADMCALPFQDNSFDTILAHLVLYHATSLHEAICEIKRVVRLEGRVGIATLSIDACSEIYTLVHTIEPKIQPYTYSAPFSVEVAKNILPKYFSEVKEMVYNADMIFDSPEPIIDFLRSLETFHPIEVNELFYEKCRNEIEKVIKKKNNFRTTFTASHFECTI